MKIAIVTGASSGMGRELVLQISKKENFDEIWVIARRREALESLQSEVTCKIRPIPLDLTKEECYKEYQNYLEQEKPNVALLANCAGFGPYINVYGASKAFVLNYSRALNRELKTAGIRVMSVNPGWVKTDFFDRATATSNDAVTYYNVMYEAKDVIRTAIHDLYHTRKDVSIHGLPIKLQVLGVKLLPHKLVMNIWMKQQKHC